MMLILLLTISMTSFANDDYKIIKQSTDGRFYLEEQDIIDIANYIKRLEELNKNYLAQIENLKQQIANLEAQILNLEEQVKTLQVENKKLQEQLRIEQLKTWSVVGIVALGTVVYLFIK